MKPPSNSARCRVENTIVCRLRQSPVIPKLIHFLSQTKMRIFFAPSPRGLSDDEEPSPSQYLLERSRAYAADKIEEEDRPLEMSSKSDDDDDPHNQYTKYSQSKAQQAASADQIY